MVYQKNFTTCKSVVAGYMASGLSVNCNVKLGEVKSLLVGSLENSADLHLINTDTKGQWIPLFGGAYVSGI